MSAMWHWLIVGGGIHGAHVAKALARAAPDTSLAILDPRPPLAAWRQRADACGMDYLRSPGAHHLGLRAGELRAFGTAHGYGPEHWLSIYRQPSRTLFEHHADRVFADLPRIVAAADMLERRGSFWRVVDSAGTAHQAQRVVLATGPGAPHRPLDAPHVFDRDFALPRRRQELVIVGGGLSAAQIALRAAAIGHGVTWVTRDWPRVSEFDSAPCYAGPKCLGPFQNASLAERKRQLVTARHSGTLPSGIHARISAAVAAGTIGWRRCAKPSLTDGGVNLGGGTTLRAEQVFQATGFTPHPPRDSVTARTVSQLGLGFDDHGNVAADECLQIAPGLHIIGRPASLVLGPMAGNIRGARLAAERLTGMITGYLTERPNPDPRRTS